MLNHAVMEEKFTREFAAVRDAYRLPPEENEYLPACLEEVSPSSLPQTLTVVQLQGFPVGHSERLVLEKG